MDILLRLSHGLGDLIQLTIVLQHLRRHRPDWVVDVQTLRGKESAVRSLCRRAYHDQETPPHRRRYGRVFDLPWYECYSVYKDSPSTKACNCLREIFDIKPDMDLCRYYIGLTAEDEAAAEKYLKSVGCHRGHDGRFNAAILHYQGNTSPEKKNLDHLTASAACLEILDCGFVPIILDWDRRSPLPDDVQIFCPRPTPGDDLWGGFGSGDAARIAALVQLSALFVGIDSGPAKAASSTTTPNICVWTGHHPVQFHDLSETLHLIPENHREIPPAQNPVAAQFFEENYRFKSYRKGELTMSLCAAIRRELAGVDGPSVENGLAKEAGFWCHGDRVDQDLTIIDDVYRNDCYQLESLRDRNVSTILDVGAHIGTFARRAKAVWPCAKIRCIEIAAENIGALVRNVRDLAEAQHSCMAGDSGSQVKLLNSFTSVGVARSTGGSAVAPADAPDPEDPQYRPEPISCRSTSLDEVLNESRWETVDLLKLDCEGSEYDILAAADLRRIKAIVGEFHGKERWGRFRNERFSGWSYRLLSEAGDVGNFHLINPLWA